MSSSRKEITSEQALVEAFARLFGTTHPGVAVAIGDDAAVLNAPRQKLVWTADSMVEGVHFRRELMSMKDVGWRSLQAAASDLAAMAARPLAALACLIVDDKRSTLDLKQLTAGQKSAAQALACPIVGGNLSSGRELSITTTVIGKVGRPLLRSGARPGEQLWLCGELGLARAGLRLLESAGRRRTDGAERRCIESYRRPKALIETGYRLAKRASAAIDVSDGLARDALHLSQAADVKIVIDAELLAKALDPALHRVSRKLGLDPLELAIQGGDDYALLATGKARMRPPAARVIGHVERGRGVVLLTSGRQQPVAGGYDHFGPR